MCTFYCIFLKSLIRLFSELELTAAFLRIKLYSYYVTQYYPIQCPGIVAAFFLHFKSRIVPASLLLYCRWEEKIQRLCCHLYHYIIFKYIMEFNCLLKEDFCGGGHSGL